MYLLGQLWAWVATTGVNLAIIVVLAFLIPRLGRFAERIVEREVAVRQSDDEQKTSLAFAGVGIYVAQIVAYFMLSLAFLSEVGFSLAGAAIPATVVSAAIGFGAQSIIADFLAGFFLLSEKQFGVGDWVRFQGNGIDVEGDVISVTMRATTIRTLAQETVTIPNSTARVCINASNFWSRAVVVMPVPLLGSESADSAIARAERAATTALSRPDVASSLIGDLAVQPATDVTPPATVGMPWTMDIRLMVQVEAGQQWAVERALRVGLLNEFWDEYGSATTTTGVLRDSVAKPAAHAPLADPDATVVAPAVRSTSEPTPQTRKPATGEGENTVPEQLANPDGSDPASDPLREETTTSEEMATATTRWQRIRAAAKETRPSTYWMLGVIGLLLLAKLLTFSAENADGERIAGIFAPPAKAPAESTSVESTPPNTPAPTYEEPAPTYTPESEFNTPTETADPDQPADGFSQAPTGQPTSEPVPTSQANPGASTPAAPNNAPEETVQPQSSPVDDSFAHTPDTVTQGAFN